MLNQPNFNPAYLVETVEPDTVFFISERESVCLQDPLYYRLVQVINGQRNVDEIIDILQLEIIQDQNLTQDNPNFFQEILNFSMKIQEALFRLHKQGYLLEKNELLPSNLAIICHHLGISQSQADYQLQSTKVTVQTLGSLTDEYLVQLLKSFQIQVADEGDLKIILTEDYLHPNLAELNQQALGSETPWMLIKPLGTISWIGPLFQPNQTGCWDCFAQRWRDNRPIEEFINRKKEQGTLLTFPLYFSQATMQTTLAIAATEIFKWIIQKNNPRLEGNLITYDHLTRQTQNHILVKRPQCSSCGKILKKQPLPVVLGHRKKAFTTDGGHRFCPPEETLRKYQYHISPITGVVRELAKIPIQGLVHTYVARHHFRSVFDNLDSLRQNMGGRSAGKGRTDIQARASGFCEAIERYSGVFQGDEIREKGSYYEKETVPVEFSFPHILLV